MTEFFLVTGNVEKFTIFWTLVGVFQGLLVPLLNLFYFANDDVKNYMKRMLLPENKIIPIQ